MTRRMMPLAIAPFLVIASIGVGTSVSLAQDAAPGHHHRIKRIRPAPVPVAPVAYRGLTINRPPIAGPGDDGEDIYRDGPVRYNDIRDFSPAPYVTSGVEYPYGLDGIGGYGSELGFSAGQDTALYNRGAGTP